LLFHNVRIGIVGTVPIAITAIVNFGVMGLLNIPLSSATALITSIAIGIGVDYAIHFLEHYTNTRLEGKTLEEATAETLLHTGRAIVLNAIAVMGGFAILLFSVFPPNRQVGALIILNMAVSAIATLTVLVVLITISIATTISFPNVLLPLHRGASHEKSQESSTYFPGTGTCAGNVRLVCRRLYRGAGNVGSV
jgi:predicted RND superfamily exporter protein